MKCYRRRIYYYIKYGAADLVSPSIMVNRKTNVNIVCPGDSIIEEMKVMLLRQENVIYFYQVKNFKL